MVLAAVGSRAELKPTGPTTAAIVPISQSANLRLLSELRGALPNFGPAVLG